MKHFGLKFYFLVFTRYAFHVMDSLSVRPRLRGNLCKSSKFMEVLLFTGTACSICAVKVVPLYYCCYGHRLDNSSTYLGVSFWCMESFFSALPASKQCSLVTDNIAHKWIVRNQEPKTMEPFHHSANSIHEHLFQLIHNQP